MDSYWPVVHREISKVRAVWWRLGKLSRQEGEDIRVPELFYREATQAFLMFRLESWVMSDVMIQAVEGTHVGFLSQFNGKRV